MSKSDFFTILAALTVEFKLQFDGQEYQLIVPHGDYGYFSSNIELDIAHGFCSVQIYNKATDRYVSTTNVEEIIGLLK